MRKCGTAMADGRRTKSGEDLAAGDGLMMMMMMRMRLLFLLLLVLRRKSREKGWMMLPGVPCKSVTSTRGCWTGVELKPKHVDLSVTQWAGLSSRLCPHAGSFALLFLPRRRSHNVHWLSCWSDADRTVRGVRGYEYTRIEQSRRLSHERWRVGEPSLLLLSETG